MKSPIHCNQEGRQVESEHLRALRGVASRHTRHNEGLGEQRAGIVCILTHIAKHEANERHGRKEQGTVVMRKGEEPVEGKQKLSKGN
ncbi:hypothetical protein E2C01_045940 [Portunus trituberculatus]|uniref:Uncharacterized protein n=1 Tax=Portunus trituberculatus TaxID=210409 RepID=A0A5B7FWG4_PORTR|nr:hypothetical protein [Portunus trituberculatus]